MSGVLLPVLLTRMAAPSLHLLQEQSLHLGDDEMLNAGDLIEITTWINNSGGSDLFNVVVNGTTCPPIPVLRVGESVICSSEYRVTQMDIDAGLFVLTTCAMDQNKTAVTCVGSTTDLTQTTEASLSVVQWIDYDLGSNGVLSVGDTANVTVTVCNNGTETLLNATAGMYSGDPVDLDPGECFEYSYAMDLLRVDFDAGSKRFEESASAIGYTSQMSVQAISIVEANLTRPIFPHIECSQTQTLWLGMDDMLNAGDVISITTVIVNQGTEDLYNVSVIDSLPVGTVCEPSNLDNQIALLAEGDSVTCVGAYQIVQNDIDLATFALSTFAQGTGFVTRASSNDTAVSIGNLTQTTFGALSVNQMADIVLGPDEFLGPGDEVVVMVKLMNVGTETLLNLTSTNSNGTITTELLPMEMVNFTYVIVLTQPMLDLGVLELNETGVGIGTTSAQPVQAQSSIEINVTQTIESRLSLSTTFTTSHTCAFVGRILFISVVVENYGTGPANNVDVQNTLVGSSMICGPMGMDNVIDELLPGQQETCTGMYMLTAMDITTGVDSLFESNSTAGGVEENGLEYVWRAQNYLSFDYIAQQVGATTGLSAHTFEVSAGATLSSSAIGPVGDCNGPFLGLGYTNLNGRMFILKDFIIHPRHRFLDIQLTSSSAPAQIITDPPSAYTSWVVVFVDGPATWNPMTGIVTPTGDNMAIRIRLGNWRDLIRIEILFNGAGAYASFNAREVVNTTRDFP